MTRVRNDYLKKADPNHHFPKPTIPEEDTDWMADARCVDYHPDLMHPGPHDWDGIATAKSICAPCQVRTTCLGWAMRVRDEWAVLGGTTPDERKSIRRRMQKWARRAQ